MATKRAVYLKHIKRLEEEKRLLTEMLIQERRLRKAAYGWYRGRLRSRFWWLVDFMLTRDKA